MKKEVNLNKIICTNIDYKVLSFFYSSQNCIDTARGVSAWINEKRADTKKSLDKLTKFEFLNSHKNRFVTGYCCTQDKKILKRIRTFLNM
jgi:hypothetical protein